MENLHKIQLQIIRELFFHPNLRFSDLNIKNITSDHFSYHISKLIELGMISKNGNKYSLSTSGKKYALLLDTENNIIEKQPKVSVLLIVETKINDKLAYLWQRRTKEPYYGYHGFITGKIKFGETVTVAAERELKEEAGISANFTHLFVFHEMVYNTKNEILEDIFFNIMYGTYISGEFISKTKEGENVWINKSDVYSIKPVYHNEPEIYELFVNKQNSFIEKKYIVQNF